MKSHLVDDEFWNDCLKEPRLCEDRQKEPSNKFPTFDAEEGNTYYITGNTTGNNSNFKKPSKPFSCRVIKEALEKENNSREQQRIKREQRAIEYCISLYNKSIGKAEALQETQNKKKNLTQINEIAGCTFKPKRCVNKMIDEKLKDYQKTKIYRRGVKYQRKHLMNITRIYEGKIEEENQCTFKPSITSSNLETVFKNNPKKFSTENDSQKLFFYRQLKAREEEEYKKTRIERELSRNAGKKWLNKNISRSISQKDSVCLKQLLHNELLTTQYNDKENSD